MFWVVQTAHFNYMATVEIAKLSISSNEYPKIFF